MTIFLYHHIATASFPSPWPLAAPLLDNYVITVPWSSAPPHPLALWHVDLVLLRLSHFQHGPTVLWELIAPSKAH